jgi:hypothetical protein
MVAPVVATEAGPSFLKAPMSLRPAACQAGWPLSAPGAGPVRFLPKGWVRPPLGSATASPWAGRGSVVKLWSVNIEDLWVDMWGQPGYDTH